MAQRLQVFSAYRRLYRARLALFKGDDQAMRESRTAVRAEFLKHGEAPIADSTHFIGLLSMVDEAVDTLRHGIVRGNLNATTGHYGKVATVYAIIERVLNRKKLITWIPCMRSRNPSYFPDLISHLLSQIILRGQAKRRTCQHKYWRTRTATLGRAHYGRNCSKTRKQTRFRQSNNNKSSRFSKQMMIIMS